MVHRLYACGGPANWGIEFPFPTGSGFFLPRPGWVGNIPRGRGRDDGRRRRPKSIGGIGSGRPQALPPPTSRIDCGTVARFFSRGRRATTSSPAGGTPAARPPSRFPSSEAALVHPRGDNNSPQHARGCFRRKKGGRPVIASLENGRAIGIDIVRPTANLRTPRARSGTDREREFSRPETGEPCGACFPVSNKLSCEGAEISQPQPESWWLSG
jgi:hypothetical protein